MRGRPRGAPASPAPRRVETPVPTQSRPAPPPCAVTRPGDARGPSSPELLSPETPRPLVTRKKVVTGGGQVGSVVDSSCALARWPECVMSGEF